MPSYTILAPEETRSNVTSKQFCLNRIALACPLHVKYPLSLVKTGSFTEGAAHEAVEIMKNETKNKVLKNVEFIDSS